MVKRMYKAIAALAAYAAATLSGCAAKPMYDFGEERGIFRLENKAKIDRFTACGRVELRGTSDDPTDIEGFVARGIVNYAIKNGWHLVGNYVAKPGGDIPLIGAGYGRKIGDNTFVRAQIKLPASDDDGTLELEGLVVYDREKASALLLVRGYPEDGTMTVEASLQGKLGRHKPIIELQASGEPSDLEVKLLAGWGIVF